LATLKVSKDSTQTHTPQQLWATNFHLLVQRAIDNGKTVTQLADEVGISRSSVYDIFNLRRKVDPPELRLWCKALNVTYDELVG